ncbi:hypothetical protein [Azospira restricta]|uniref:NnrS family protein n=1 Tax=Azospira restricta TaxID=404405 RepID=A0A974Y502_9RHOO|nr:hypothetical protein [Azospira restricta]QRJ64954.1 hypothetical protein IWH25_06325 [Azospira restricta]
MSALPSSGGGLAVGWRVPLLVIGMLSLLAGVAAGLLRAGWGVPLPDAALAAQHGPLMAAAFFGTVIGLERAVALGRRWAFLSPLAAGAGGLLLIAGAPPFVALPLLAVGGGLLTAATLVAAARQPALHTRILALAAALAALAPLAWLLAARDAAIAGWAAFLVLTIAGERLELSRFLPPSPRARAVFVGIVGALLLALAATAANAAGLRLFGGALVALAVWLLRQDIARRTVRQQGLTRFIAVCLLSGYFWLLAGGLLLALQPPGPLLMDAALHAVFVGFVLAMVFGHAPIIFPAIVRVSLPYRPRFYLPLAVLHASLLLRVAGDLAGLPDWRAWGAAGNALCLILFIATMVAAALAGRAEAQRKTPA